MGAALAARGPRAHYREENEQEPEKLRHGNIETHLDINCIIIFGQLTIHTLLMSPFPASFTNLLQ